MELTATEIALVALLLFLGLLVYLKVPATILGALDSRSQEIANELQEARRLREEAEKLLADYEAKRLAAEAEAKEIVATAKEQAALVAEETRANMMAAMQRREKQAEERIASASTKAAADVRAAAAEAAIAAAEKLVRDRLNESAQAALVRQGAADLKQKFG